MKKHIVACLFALTLFFPSSALAVDAACGDSVPAGVWPNCDPCAGEGATEAVEAVLKKHGNVLDTTVDPTAYDYVEKCLAALEKIFFVNVGLPSLDEILGMLCEATRQYSKQWIDKLNQRISVSGPYGIATGSVGVGDGKNFGGIKVRDTSRQAVEAAKVSL